MQIEQNKVVTLHYTMKDDQGAVLESTENREPLAYIQGTQTILPALENLLEGKNVGESFQIRVPMDEAFGPRREELVRIVNREQFSPDVEIKPGQEFYYLDENDEVISVTVMQVNGDDITIDYNHPFAGLNLNFDIRIMDVRDATTEELEHGHVHGPGGVHH
jgi:FKBP-type peptidyl-prolyl cis-trans isomerase SlyD